MKKVLVALSLGLAALLSACAPTASEPTAQQLTDLLEKNPTILTNAIDKNPAVFMAAVQKAAQQSQADMQKNQARQEEQQLEEQFKNPLKPELDPKRVAMGNPNAPITIVEYTDFQCPYCARGYSTMEEVKKAYGDKVKVVVKHLPLPMHPLAPEAAQKFEAIKLQSPDKAFAFYNDLFQNQQKITSQYMDEVAKKVGANVAKMKKDMNSKEVLELIEKDKAEAASFGIQGTPGFLVNGVAVKGAYPPEHFKKIIDRQLSQN